jgi:thiol:disulfide interchange protein
LTVQLRVAPDPQYHVYPLAADTSVSRTVTLMAFELPEGWTASEPTTSAKRVEETYPSIGKVTYHDGDVTWETRIRVPQNAASGSVSIGGLVGFQTCRGGENGSCDLPSGLSWAIPIEVVSASGQTPSAPQAKAATIQKGSFTKVGNHPQLGLWSLANSTPTPGDGGPLDGSIPLTDGGGSGDAPTDGDSTGGTQANSMSLALLLGSAMLGGFLLNFMPCVLPVLGLKVMSLVSQSGSEKRRVVWLNLAQLLGIFVVFMAFAAMIIGVRVYGNSTFIWGSQNQNDGFTITILVTVFVFTLSMFDLWEIPVPGFATGSVSQKLQQQEGFAGVFFKGILMTVLATPCSGPFLAQVFSSVAKQPAAITVLVFAAMAIGFGFPYIVLSVRPSLLKWMPKPGHWMETFKQLMGFAMLASVVYYFTQVNPENRVIAMAYMFAAWFAVWLGSRVPIYAPAWQRGRAWVAGIMLGILFGMGSNYVLRERARSELDIVWEDYSTKTLQSHLSQGKTVMIDFTADWCPTCQTNWLAAIDTAATAEVVRRNNVVAIKADMSEENEEIDQKLEELQQSSIPLLVIYPAGAADKPIRIPDVVSQSTVLEALKQAGPSRDGTTMAQRPSKGQGEEG